MPADDDNEIAIVVTPDPGPVFGARELLDVIDAIRRVAMAELAKGPGIASNAWRDLADVIAPLVGDVAQGEPIQVKGRQPVVMPPGYRHAIPPRGGAVPLVQPENIKSRADVAAELARVARGGK
jgi:hypothetical protein